MNICEKIESIRPVGKVTCGLFHGSEIWRRKERIKKYGYYAIPDVFWENISADEALNLLVDSICYHIEDHERILDEEIVKPVVAGYINSFPADTRYYTNCKSGYECMSHSFLDIAILMETNKGVVGLVCVEDEQQP